MAKEARTEKMIMETKMRIMIEKEVRKGRIEGGGLRGGGIMLGAL